MAAKPIIQGQEFPVVTPTSIKDIDEIPVSVDQERVRVVCLSIHSVCFEQEYESRVDIRY